MAFYRICRTARTYKVIFSTLGPLFMIMGLLFLTPLLGLFFYPDEVSGFAAFLIPSVFLLLLGLSLKQLIRGGGDISIDEAGGSIVVVIAWITASVIGTYPFIRLQGLTFVQALFESVSGWTTTGLSVVDVTSASHLILLWRSITQLAGGAGLAILMLAAFSLPVGAGLYRAEGRGYQLVPHVVKSARLVVTLYLGYALAGIIGYALAGMSLFDAVNHAFAAVSTGGFSTRPESIGYWNSSFIEAVSIPLMILGNMNFLTAYLLFSGKIRAFFRNGELRCLAVLLIAGIVFLFFTLTFRLYPTLEKGVRVAVFEAVTAITTTGFSTVGYADWNSAAMLMMILFMLIGGGSCSTAGGIKQYRVYLLWRSIRWEIRRAVSPRNMVVARKIHQMESYSFIPEGAVTQTGIFIFLYMLVFLAGSLIFTAYGYGLKDSLFEFASSLGTVGLSVGITSPETPVTLLWVQIVGMFLGRLEFFVVFAAVAKVFQNIRDMM